MADAFAGRSGRLHAEIERRSQPAAEPYFKQGDIFVADFPDSTAKQPRLKLVMFERFSPHHPWLMVRIMARCGNTNEMLPADGLVLLKPEQIVRRAVASDSFKKNRYDGLPRVNGK